MPAFLLALLPILKAAASGLWAVVNSPLGRLGIAALVAYGYGRHQASRECAAREAAAQAELARAYRAEIDRQRTAAEDIARDATERAAQDALAARAMQAKIDEFANRERGSHVTLSQTIPSSRAAASAAPHPCFVDDDMARVVRDIDAAHSTPQPPRRPRRVR